MSFSDFSAPKRLRTSVWTMPQLEKTRSNWALDPGMQANFRPRHPNPVVDIWSYTNDLALTFCCSFSLRALYLWSIKYAPNATSLSALFLLILASIICFESSSASANKSSHKSTHSASLIPFAWNLLRAAAIGLSKLRA